MDSKSKFVICSQMNISTKQKQTHRHGEQTCGCQVGGGRGGRNWEFGVSSCKLLYMGWINKVLLNSTESCIQYPVINHNGKEYGKTFLYICMYVCVHMHN